ncbi:MAG: hypothetical protein ABIM46_00620 [candidate division WOR-3 bacterium]
MKRIGLFAGLVLAEALQLELPEGFKMTNLVANGGDYIYGTADSSGVTYLMKWSADGKLLIKRLSEACCGYLCLTKDYLVVSEATTSRLTIFTTDLDYIKEVILKTKCPPPRMTFGHKHVYPLEDGRLLVIGKYFAGETLAVATIWDTSGKFLGVFLSPDSAWAKSQPFAASPIFCRSKGDTVLAVDFFPFKLYLISIKCKPELLDSFTVRIKKRKNFSTPEGEAAEEYEAFVKWMEEECTSNHPVLGKQAYPLSDGRIVFEFAQCASVVDIDMSPHIGIYDPAKRKVLWAEDLNTSILGGIRGDTLLMGASGCNAKRTVLQKAVVK